MSSLLHSILVPWIFSLSIVRSPPKHNLTQSAQSHSHCANFSCVMVWIGTQPLSISCVVLWIAPISLNRCFDFQPHSIGALTLNLTQSMLNLTQSNCDTTPTPPLIFQSFVARGSVWVLFFLLLILTYKFGGVDDYEKAFIICVFLCWFFGSFVMKFCTFAFWVSLYHCQEIEKGFICFV